MMNIVNGGAHSDAPIDFQEFMIMPKDFPTFSEALRAGVEIFHALKGELKKRGLSTAIGDEGGFAPAFSSAEDALDSIANAVKAAGYKFGKQVFIALDSASSGSTTRPRRATCSRNRMGRNAPPKKSWNFTRSFARPTRLSRSRMAVRRTIGKVGSF
jgi:enolase